MQANMFYYNPVYMYNIHIYVCGGGISICVCSIIQRVFTDGNKVENGVHENRRQSKIFHYIIRKK